MIDPAFDVDTHHSARVTDAQARKTALVVACVLLLVAAWGFYRGRTNIGAVCGASAFALTLAGYFLPALARRFHVYWLRLAAALGYVNSRVLLSLLFYGVFTPYRVASRIFRRDPLARRGPKRESYWTTRKATRQAKEQFERLF